MTHFGLLCPAASGHLNPMTTLGHELRRRGHGVTLFCIVDGEAKAVAAGLNFVPLGESDFPRGAMAEAFAELGRLSGGVALKYTLNLFKKATLCLLKEAPDAIRRHDIDFLLVDQSSFGGPEVARHLDLPFVSVCCALMFNREPGIPPINTNWPYRPDWWGKLRNAIGYKIVERVVKPLADVLVEYRRIWHLPAIDDPNKMFSELGQICQQPREFEFPRSELPANFHFTGPYANPSSREPADFPFDRLDGRPLIYASLGTIQNRLLHNYRLIAEACSNMDAQLVIALGGGSQPDDLPDLQGDPIVVGYAPQLELLERASLTITHAGMNTTLESLKHGVPMVAIPIANDQPGVAARITWSGTGESIPLKRLTLLRLKQKISQVLSEDRYRQNARRMQSAIERSGGVKSAADIVERLAQAREASHE